MAFTVCPHTLFPKGEYGAFLREPESLMVLTGLSAGSVNSGTFVQLFQPQGSACACPAWGGKPIVLQLSSPSAAAGEPSGENCAFLGETAVSAASGQSGGVVLLPSKDAGQRAAPSLGVRLALQLQMKGSSRHGTATHCRASW